MFVLGLTGGIACGKSTVAAWLRQQGAEVIDADATAHSLMAPGGRLYAAYVAHWGRTILRADGSLDRRAIGKLVFGQPAAEHWLNATAHPLIHEAILAELERLRTADCKICVLDVPLLYESGWEQLCDRVCVVWLTHARQKHRLMVRNGYSAAEAEARIAAQLPLAEKRRRADYCIDNNGTCCATKRQVLKLWEEMQHENA